MFISIQRTILVNNEKIFKELKKINYNCISIKNVIKGTNLLDRHKFIMICQFLFSYGMTTLVYFVCNLRLPHTKRQLQYSLRITHKKQPRSYMFWRFYFSHMKRLLQYTSHKKNIVRYFALASRSRAHLTPSLASSHLSSSRAYCISYALGYACSISFFVSASRHERFSHAYASLACMYTLHACSASRLYYVHASLLYLYTSSRASCLHASSC